MIIEIASFLKKHIGFIPHDTVINILKEQLNGEKYYEICDADYNKTISNHKEYELKESEWAEVSMLQNQGMAFEKNGQLEKAVDSYEKAIALGEASNRIIINNYLHSIERLAIVYRKLKRYEDEIRIVSIGLKYQNDNVLDNYYVRLRNRLSKAQLLLDKQNR